jgi:opacity protein-like surface antigen
MTKITTSVLVGAVALVLASGGIAEAQSLGAGPWNGFYVGGHVGNTWADTSTNTSNTATGAPVASGSTSVSNPHGGLQGGYDFTMSSRFVLGVLAAVSLVDSSDTTTTTTITPAGLNVHTSKADTDWSGSIRARLGYAFDNALVFGTAGWAWSTGSVTRTQVTGTTGLAIPGTTELVGTSHSGWTLGGGLEYAVAPQWTVFGEYRHTEFGSENINFPVAQRLTNSTTTSDGLTFGVNYKF